MEYDLDAEEAARAEKRGEGHSVVYGGVSFSLPPTLTHDFSEELHESGRFSKKAVYMLLGEEQGDRFYEMTPNIDVISDLFTKAVAKFYGTSPGESSASKSSSKRTSKTSRPRSNATTA